MDFNFGISFDILISVHEFVCISEGRCQTEASCSREKLRIRTKTRELTLAMGKEPSSVCTFAEFFRLNKRACNRSNIYLLVLIR
jgi:hypothetical protein